MMKNFLEELREIREEHYIKIQTMTEEEIQKEISESADRVIKKMEELNAQKCLEPVK